MTGRIILVSEESNFFEFIKAKLELRKSDELFLFSFEQLLKNKHLIKSGVIIINAENNSDITLKVLETLNNLPIIIMTFNEDEIFKKKCYRLGAIDYIPLLTPDAEFRARMIPALSISTLIEKNNQYRDILVENKIIDNNLEIYTNYEKILDMQINEIKRNSIKAVIAAISPNDISIQNYPKEQIEKTLLENLRRNDIMMTYAPNKYFIIMYNITPDIAEKFWVKISEKLPIKIFAGFSQVTNQTRQQLISEVLNKLHIAINLNKNSVSKDQNPINNLSGIQTNSNLQYNFKLFKQDFIKKIEQIVTPVFYNIQLKHSTQQEFITTEEDPLNGLWKFIIKTKNNENIFKITTPGYSKINIDIECIKDQEIDAKRITFDPCEFEINLLMDLLEQFILECHIK